MIRVKAPGKLYIAEEYAVTESRYRSVLIVLDRSVIATIEETDQYKDTIHPKVLYRNPVTFSRDEDSIAIPDPHAAEQLDYVVTATETFEQYAESYDIAMKHFYLTTDNNLDNPNGHRYGLGSSAAVLVSVVEVLNKFYGMKLSNLYIHRLAVIASIRLQSLSPCGDIAVDAYSEWLAYNTFDHKWIKHQIEDTTIGEVLIKNWPGLHVEPPQAPENMEILIGRAGSPASSPHFVSKVKRLGSGPSSYGDFLEDSHRCVEKLIHAFKTNNIKSVQKVVRQNRTITQRMSKGATIDIKAEELKHLCDIVERYRGVSRTPGAGSRSCGITIINKDVDKEKIYDEWTKHGIKPLEFSIYHEQ